MSTFTSSRPALRLQLRRARQSLRSRRWRRAARATKAGFARGGAPAGWVALGETHHRQKRWDEAAQAFENALALDDSRPGWFARLGRLYERRRRWEDAVQACESATALDDRHPEWYVQLGGLYERMHKKEEAEAAFREWMARDPNVSELDHALLAASSRRFRPRQTLTRFVAEHLDEIRERVLATSTERGVEWQPRVFSYWGQGFSEMPPVVRRCQQELRRHHSDDEIVLLDDATVPYYVDLPDAVRRKVSHDRAKFSDVLRVALLARYGGVWMDATVLPTGRVLDRAESLMPNGFFAFTYRRAGISSWFLASEPGGYLASMLREANYAYWEHFDRPIDYYYFHHLFEALYLTDEKFHSLWDGTSPQSSHPPHRFKHAMYQPYDGAQFLDLLGACFVHKLSFKVRPAQLSPDSMLAHLVRNGPGARRAWRSAA